MKMKMIVVTFSLVLTISLAGCGGGTPAAENAADTLPAEQTQASEVVSPEAPASAQTLSPEYQSLVNDILAAVEQGYHYQGEGMFGGIETVIRQSQYVMSGDPEAEGFMVSYTIGTVGENGYQYQVIKVEGEVSDIYKNEMMGAGMDAVGEHLHNLILMLEAYASGSLYEDSAYAQWEVLEVTMSQEGSATVVTVKTKLPTSELDPTVETYTIADGLLEAFSMSTPYINQGQVSESTYTYLSRGPVDGTPLKALYEEAENPAQ